MTSAATCGWGWGHARVVFAPCEPLASGTSCTSCPSNKPTWRLRDFLQERWKGLLPILWGAQLKQERLDELIYLSVLNADHLPGEKASRLGPAMYEKGTVEENPDAVI